MTDRRSYPEKARERIRAGMIMTRLQKHVAGEIEMQPTQINAARILLGKVLPDLKFEEQGGKVEHEHTVDKQSVAEAVNNVKALIESIRARDT